jgi:uncharacterized protein DUF937
MQMHDALRHTPGGAALADLAATFSVTTEQVAAAMQVVGAELAWHIEKNTLSRCGLADLVEAVGAAAHAKLLEGADFRGEAMRAEGNAILGNILGSKHRSRALAARAARRAGLTAATVQAMLPGLAVVTMAGLAARARTGLRKVLSVMPPQGRWSRGSPHADLADILRRGCGAGPYPRAKLRRVVRGAVVGGGSFRPRGAVRWYLGFMLARPALAPVARMLARFLRTA